MVCVSDLKSMKVLGFFFLMEFFTLPTQEETLKFQGRAVSLVHIHRIHEFNIDGSAPSSKTFSGTFYQSPLLPRGW